MSVAHSDDKLVDIRSTFGMWGIGVYWTLVERVAEQMKGVDLIPVAAFDENELCSFCGCKRNKLETFLKHLQNIRGIKWQRSGNIIKIEVPKLLEIKDNYHIDLEETSKKLPSKEVEEDVEQKERKIVRTHFQKPLLDDVKDYFCSIELPDEAGAFYDYYEGNGWRVGRNPMKDWKAACRNWKRNSNKFSRGSNGTTNRQPQPGSVQARATYSHKPEDEKRFRELQESLEQRDRERGQRS